MPTQIAVLSKKKKIKSPVTIQIPAITTQMLLYSNESWHISLTWSINVTVVLVICSYALVLYQSIPNHCSFLIRFNITFEFIQHGIFSWVLTNWMPASKYIKIYYITYIQCMCMLNVCIGVWFIPLSQLVFQNGLLRILVSYPEHGIIFQLFLFIHVDGSPPHTSFIHCYNNCHPW